MIYARKAVHLLSTLNDTQQTRIWLAGRTLKESRHICDFFHSREEQNKVLMPFFKASS